MTVNGWKTIIARCSNCGKIFEGDFNLFSCDSKGKEEFICQCGNKLAYLEVKTKRTAILNINCNFCGDIHKYYFNIIDTIINNKVYNCNYGAEICIVGDIKNNHNFTNSDIMILSLKMIDELNVKEYIQCKCGSSHIACDIYSDRLELRCTNCNGIMIIYAEDEDDLQLIKDKKSIKLEKNDITCLGSKRDTMRDLIDL